ncbi:ribbon-helix-helix domain-containing protein [Aromatoleum toluclasticum]|uniref:ribbon-helix-helix domain-containing protein n=1 Tax=Aromatoleum toluclasticum TaxID=92003 RepID=UPI001D18201E|nr:ribbon-helix-helix domain-containing protein [Aromatoleum toluclasticum]MCC4115290.1 ribbon-helix-helix domain-containing protein [Aromatoleum toluclasticum]
MEMEQRPITLPNGKRSSIRLDEPTWAAIDWLAERSGQKWAVWCNNVIETVTEGENATAALRAAAMDGILAETLFPERAAQHADPSSVTWKNLAECGDRDFDYALEQAAKDGTIEGHADCGGFTVYSGVSEHGNVTYYIRNNLKDGSNVIINTPYRLEEWAATWSERMEG